MNFEKQLAAIKTKADMHTWVDTLDLDAGATGIILVGRPAPNGDSGGSYLYYEIGDTTVSQASYMATAFMHWLHGGRFD